jgi:hypothetical protein
MKPEYLTTQTLLESWPSLADDVRAELLSAVATRGKWQGYLPENAPKDPARAIAWQALVSWLAPNRASVVSLMIALDHHRRRYDQLDRVIEAVGLPLALNAVEPEMRWNLWAYHNNRDAVLGVIARNLPEETA